MSRRRTWTGVGIGCAVGAFAAFWDPTQFSHSFYYAYFIWLFVSLGALAQLMTHHLTEGRWGYATQRLLEAALAPLPMLAGLLIAFALLTPILQEGAGYFELKWILLRMIFCFGIWIAMANRLCRLSVKQDKQDSVVPTIKIRTLSGPGLVVLFLTISLAMTDWLMQLQPGWRSTVFPLVMMASQTLLALAGVTYLAARGMPRMEHAAVLQSPRTWIDLGTLLFAFVILWAYLVFSQFLIIWAGNLPGETSWFLRRGVGGWKWLGWGIGAFCFFLPAFVLLFRRLKRSRQALARVAIGIWISQAVFLFWVVAPSLHPDFQISWMDLLLPIALGMVWSGIAWNAWSAVAAFPRNVPYAVGLEGQGV